MTQLLQPHQQRVVAEKRELDMKVAALDNFLGSPMFKSLTGAEQVLLESQSEAMDRYTHILGLRIAAFS